MLASETLSEVLPLGLPNLAEMLADPGPVADTSPVLASTAATARFDEFHWMPGVPVTSNELPSLNVASARICALVFFAIFDTGRTVIFDTVLASTVAVVVSLTPPTLAVISELP